MGQLEGKVAIVTAGGAGIGQAIVWLLAERGASVLAVDISAEGLAETLAQARAPERIQTCTADVTALPDTARAVETAMAAFGAVNILANVVGGRSAITPDMSLRLGTYFGNGPELWLNMQQEHDLWHARRAMKAALAKIEPASAAA